VRSHLWAIIVVVAAIMGFLMGYSTSPMIETGMLGGSGAAPAPKGETKKEIEQYYKDLLKEK